MRPHFITVRAVKNVEFEGFLPCSSILEAAPSDVGREGDFPAPVLQMRPLRLSDKEGQSGTGTGLERQHQGLWLGVPTDFSLLLPCPGGAGEAKGSFYLLGGTLCFGSERPNLCINEMVFDVPLGIYPGSWVQTFRNTGIWKLSPFCCHTCHLWVFLPFQICPSKPFCAGTSHQLMDHFGSFWIIFFLLGKN